MRNRFCKCESTFSTHTALHPQLMMMSRMHDELSGPNCLGCCLGSDRYADGFMPGLATASRVTNVANVSQRGSDHFVQHSFRCHQTLYVSSMNSSLVCLSEHNTYHISVELQDNLSLSFLPSIMSCVVLRGRAGSCERILSCGISG